MHIRTEHVYIHQRVLTQLLPLEFRFHRGRGVKILRVRHLRDEAHSLPLCWQYVCMHVCMYVRMYACVKSAQ